MHTNIHFSYKNTHMTHIIIYLSIWEKRQHIDLEINEIMVCRPICKGEVIKKVITKALYKPYKNKMKAGCEPSQFSVRTNGGGSHFIMAITLLLEANPDWVIIALDILNAFNEIQRYSILEKFWNKLIFDLYGTTTSVIWWSLASSD